MGKASAKDATARRKPRSKDREGVVSLLPPRLLLLLSSRLPSRLRVLRARLSSRPSISPDPALRSARPSLRCGTGLGGGKALRSAHARDIALSLLGQFK